MRSIPEAMGIARHHARISYRAFAFGERLARHPARGLVLAGVVRYARASYSPQFYIMAANENLKDPDGKPLDPEAQAVVNRVRRMSMISGSAMMIGIAVIIGVIGYRLFRTDAGGPVNIDVVTMLPKGAKVTTTQVAGDRVVVTLDVGGTVEIRTFDARTLQPAGRLRFANEP